MRIRARWHAVGILLVALAAPRMAHAAGDRTDTLRRAVANVLLGPLDVALSPVVTVQALYDNAKAANYSEMPVGLTLLVSKSFTDWQPAPFFEVHGKPAMVSFPSAVIPIEFGVNYLAAS